jgi:hypothetical protein
MLRSENHQNYSRLPICNAMTYEFIIVCTTFCYLKDEKEKSYGYFNVHHFCQDLIIQIMV